MVKFSIPGMASKQYDQVWKDLRESGNENPKGLLHHVGAQGKNNIWAVVDIWETEESFNDFAQILMPILTKNGIASDKAQPEILPVHYLYSREKVSI